MRIGYLCSAYPAVSHTFVLREVEALRELGAEIETFTIHRAEPEQLLSEADREAFRTTFAILPPRWPRLARAHLRLALRAPLAYLATLALALRLSPRSLRGPLWQVFYFGEAVLLWDQCRRQGIRHLHVHFANVAADVALLASHIGSSLEPARPWSWSFTMHGPTEFYDVPRFRLAQKVRLASFVVCISEFARSQLMMLTEPGDWPKLRVIHVGLPVEQFSPARAAEAAPCRDSRARILCIGRLVAEKGHAVLLEATTLLAARGCDVEVVLAGTGPERSRLEGAAADLGIADRVQFLGAVGQDELCSHYARASAFCLASFAEGVPVVLMEAMAMELPVVSTRITGIPELIEHGREGLLVTPGRPDELANALAKLLAEAALARELGERGREKVLRAFSAEASAAALYATFEELVPGLKATRRRAPSRLKAGI